MTLRRVKLLFIILSLKGGGAERVLCTLLRHIDRGKFQLTLAVLDASDAAYWDDLPRDIEVILLHCPRMRQAILKIVQLIWRLQPDVVFSTQEHLNVSLSILRPLLPNCARYIVRETIIVSLLASVYRVPFWWNWAYRRFSRLDAVVCQSESMRNDLVQNYGLPMLKTVVINNPVDISRVRRLAAEPIDTGISKGERADSNTIELVAAGSINDRRKGFDLLIEALALCGNPRLRLTVLGDGSLREELQNLAIKRGLAGQVRFVGFQKNPYPYLSHADAFVLSSRFEGMPNVVLEALACGTPVIATPAPGGVSEILAGVEGCVLATNVTAEALADAIQHFSFGRKLNPDVVAPYGTEFITPRFEQVFTA